MPDDRRWNNNPSLRLWAVELNGKDTKGHYRRNKTIHVAAPDINKAIEAAIREWGDADPWVVSASHRGPVNLVIQQE